MAQGNGSTRAILTPGEDVGLDTTEDICPESAPDGHVIKEVRALIKTLGVSPEEAIAIWTQARRKKGQPSAISNAAREALEDLQSRGIKREVIRRDMPGLEAALHTFDLGIRENRRSLRIEIRHVRFSSGIGRDWYTGQNIKVPPDGWIPLTDPIAAKVRDDIEQRFSWADGKAAKWGPGSFNESLLAMLATRGVDPVREWLEALSAWDGVRRLDRLLIDALECKDTKLNREVASRFLIGAVGRTYNPGCIHDWIPVIVGEQGCGKSTLLVELPPPDFQDEWFSESVDFGQPRKEQVESASGAIIVEFSELKGVHRTALESLKSFISRRTDIVRLSYRRYPETVRRCWVGAGTANSDGVGVLPYDASGQRRFVIVETPLPYNNEVRTRRVRAYMGQNREQLWAEARARYMDAPEDERTNLHVIPSTVISAQQAVNKEYVRQKDSSVDAADNLTTTYAGKAEGITLIALIVETGFEYSENDALRNVSMQIELAKLLSERGWYKNRDTIDGKQATRWYPPISVASAPDDDDENPPETAGRSEVMAADIETVNENNFPDIPRNSGYAETDQKCFVCGRRAYEQKHDGHFYCADVDECTAHIRARRSR